MKNSIAVLMYFLTGSLVVGCATPDVKQTTSARTTHDGIFQSDSVAPSVYFMSYIHPKKGNRYQESVKSLQDHALTECRSKGFTRSKFAVDLTLDLLDIRTPYSNVMTDNVDGRSRSAYHVICSGAANLPKVGKFYQMSCTADIECAAVDAKTDVPNIHNDAVNTIVLTFSSLQDEKSDSYEHSVLFLNSRVSHWTWANGPPDTDTGGLDFAMSNHGLIKNIRKGRSGVELRYGELNIFTGWMVLHQNEPAAQWQFISWHPNADKSGIEIKISPLTDEFVNAWSPNS